ncbi:MAG: 2-oxoglutarate and iron-dependent oxygenase domain-containing protein [Woeseia sp.]|nr:2-oxoglutarate and iron-dependent oxygenase domain-containing protein [Woeseia sp.]
MKVPVIDFQGYDEGQSGSPASLSNEVELALSQIGFMSVTNLGIDKQMLDRVFAASRAFFSSDASSKLACAYQSASENFGYQGVCEEHLDPTKPADLKETFTMRNVLNGTDKLTSVKSEMSASSFRQLPCSILRTHFP